MGPGDSSRLRSLRRYDPDQVPRVCSQPRALALPPFHPRVMKGKARTQRPGHPYGCHSNFSKNQNRFYPFLLRCQHTECD
jgi:hypothetical protein